MNNLPILNTVVFAFQLYFSFQVHQQVVATFNYTPTDEIFLNCGCSRNIPCYGRKWIGDLSSSEFGPWESSTNKSITASASFQGSVDRVPYLTARLSRSQFTYSFSVSPGKKFIRLHFYPASYQSFGISRDFFNVKAGSHVLLSNFSASLFASAWGTPSFFKEFCVNVGVNQKLNVTFYPFTSDFKDTYAFVNGIEIVSMPETLYYSSSDSVGQPFLGQKRVFSIGNGTVMEKVCRLNVGGSLISPINDTGLYRSWDTDEQYMNPLRGVVAREHYLTLNYSKIPRYTAPDDLYKSARSMGNDSTLNVKTNLTWGVPVDAGFNYLVRLHFCEFDIAVTKVKYRKFYIFIDNQTAESGFDVFESSGGSKIPMYKDYIVAAGVKSINDYTIFIALHPYPSSFYADAILNGLEVFKLSNTDGNLAAGTNPERPVSLTPAPALVPSPHPTIGKLNKKRRLFLVLGASILVLLLILSSLCLVATWCIIKRKKRNDSDYDSSICGWLLNHCDWCFSRNAKEVSSSLPNELCRKFSLSEIKAATTNFHHNLIIGTGGFGNVYKGEIDEKAKVVAIKRFNPESRSRQGVKEFKTEIEMLSQLRHVHLVPLIGYCNDRGEMILVYDYMQNGTLKEHLYETSNDLIPWKQRLEICIGAARGLHYLHEGTINKIIHRDVKTTNILLDENWVAKVSDFGLSKIFFEGKEVVTLVRGTHGYLDPEYARGQPLTEKSDVYAFGVVLLEVLCARRAVNIRLDEDQRNLANWVQKCIHNETIHEIMDPYLMGRVAPECFNKFVEVAEQCVREQGTKRPTMRKVMEMLEFALELQVVADAEQKKGKDLDGGNGDFFYPEVPFRAPSIYIDEDIGSHSDSDDCFDSDAKGFNGLNSSVNFHGQDFGGTKSGSIFSGTTSSSA